MSLSLLNIYMFFGKSFQVEQEVFPVSDSSVFYELKQLISFDGFGYECPRLRPLSLFPCLSWMQTQFVR